VLTGLLHSWRPNSFTPCARAAERRPRSNVASGISMTTARLKYSESPACKWNCLAKAAMASTLNDIRCVSSGIAEKARSARSKVCSEIERARSRLKRTAAVSRCHEAGTTAVYRPRSISSSTLRAYARAVGFSSEMNHASEMLASRTSFRRARHEAADCAVRALWAGLSWPSETPPEFLWRFF
jgi:hypothetical protein